MAIADELVTILGVDIAKNALSKIESFQKGINSVKNTLLGFSATIAATATGIGFMVNSSANEAQELQSLAEKTGLSTDAIQEWSYAVKQAGGDSKALQGDILKLQGTFGGSGRQAEKMLLSFSQQMKSMSGSQAQNFGRAWGLSDDTIALLKKGKDGIQDLKREGRTLGSIIPEASIKQANEFKRRLTEVRSAIHGITAQVSMALMPALSHILDKFKEWLGVNREWISLKLQSFTQGVANGLERFWKQADKLLSVFDPLVNAIKPFFKGMSEAETISRLVTGALTGLLIVFSPLIAEFLAIGAGLVALSVLFEDFFGYLDGQDSAIGRLFDAFEKRFPKLSQAIKDIGKYFKENFIDMAKAVWENLKVVFGAIGEVLMQILGHIESMVTPTREFFSTFEQRFPALMALFKACGNAIKKFIGGAFEWLKVIIDKIAWTVKQLGSGIVKLTEGAEWVASKFGFGDDTEKPKDARNFSTIAIQAGQRQQVPAGTSQQIHYMDNRTNNQTIYSTDPHIAGNVASKSFMGQPVGTPGSTAPAY